MKRFYHFLMFLILGILLIGCTSSESSKKEDKKTESTKKSKKKKSKKDKKDKDDEEDFDEEESDEEETRRGKKSSKSDIPLKDYMAIDNENYSLRIKDIEEDEYLGYVINIEIENKSSDKDFRFGSYIGSINGLQAEVSFYAEVNHGKKSNTTIEIENLKNYGIGKCTDIEFTVNAYYYVGEDELESEALHDPVRIYPYGEENAVQFTREAQAADQVLIDNEYLTITFVGVDNEDVWGYAVEFYIVNKTDKVIKIYGDDESVDGYMTETYYVDTIGSNNKCFSRMRWDENTFEANNIDESNISNIEFTVSIYDYDEDNLETLLTTQEVSFTP